MIPDCVPGLNHRNRGWPTPTCVTLVWCCCPIACVLCLRPSPSPYRTERRGTPRGRTPAPASALCGVWCTALETRNEVSPTCFHCPLTSFRAPLRPPLRRCSRPPVRTSTPPSGCAPPPYPCQRRAWRPRWTRCAGLVCWRGRAGGGVKWPQMSMPTLLGRCFECPCRVRRRPTRW